VFTFETLTFTTVVNAITISELSSSGKLIHKENFYLILKPR